MYPHRWFENFADTVPEATAAAELDAVLQLAPPREYPRLLDVACGTGRTAAPLSRCGTPGGSL